jgi:hypothetical protein
MSILNDIVIMDETMVSFHIPKTKTIQTVDRKGETRHHEARVHVSRTKQMVMAFFDSHGIMYTHIVPMGSKINAIYIVNDLGLFLKKMRQTWPEIVSRERFFHWENAPVQAATIVQVWIAAYQITVLGHPPYLPDLALADYIFLVLEGEGGAGWHPV